MKLLNFKLLFTIVLGTIIMSSCLKDKDYEPVPHAVFTMVNGYTEDTKLAYYADNNRIPLPFGFLQYQEMERYRNLFVGNRRIRIVDESQKTIIDTNYTFKDSTSYTSFVFGNDEATEHIITEDQSVEDLGDETAVRFLHLSTIADEVSVYIGSDSEPVFAGRTTESASSPEENHLFVANTSGKQNIVVKNTDGTTIIEREYDFKPGRYLSIILVGERDNTETPLYLGIAEQY
ncbi:DUF4397 domain-containing protein [Sphingobacterium alkalisoli]|uniref:DUF4397 domain-containing protein n=1 Tax=Sphingobacterium alkalisoli TaxID=1874115 RepID=A0A4U0GWV2_9SPHI|nr:DUF4397 domain-containing protein [Sphingobacterium alkalisoli]TJY63587.1 DUF4397 domain-containing protein [Sphingobacterium alkalisoli]GGH27008.1 hypothetical protein GCM10011418_36660 [Sphingobacterium alkalisoli]